MQETVIVGKKISNTIIIECATFILNHEFFYNMAVNNYTK